MSTKKFVYGALATLFIVTGWLVGSCQNVEAQSSFDTGEWRMFRGNMAGTGG